MSSKQCKEIFATPDNIMHPTSKAARVLNLYNTIDSKIETHYKLSRKKPPCHAGCSMCCYQFFSISEIEFELILDYLKSLDSILVQKIVNNIEYYWDNFKKSYPEISRLFEENWENESIEKLFSSHHKIVRAGISHPCIFLDQKEKICNIYKVRPIICRIHGVAYDKNMGFGRSCPKIWIAKWAMRWQVDLRDLYGEIETTQILYSKEHERHPNYQPIILRPFPIIYHMYDAFVKNKTGLNSNNRFIHFNISEKDYLEILFNQILKKRNCLMKD